MTIEESIRADPSEVDRTTSPFSGRVHVARTKLASAQKSNAAVGAYLRYVNRRVGGWLACLAYGARLTPSQVSALSGISAAFGLIVLALAPATLVVGVVVSVALAASYALDSADGQLARLRGGGTPFGEWLDHVLDIGKMTVLHSCVLIMLYRDYREVPRGFLLVPIAFLVTGTVKFFGDMLRDQLRANVGLPAQPPSTRTSVASSLVLLPIDHGTVCWMFLLLSWHAGFLTVYAALALVSAIFAARAAVRTHRNLTGLVHTTSQ